MRHSAIHPYLYLYLSGCLLAALSACSGEQAQTRSTATHRPVAVGHPAGAIEPSALARRIHALVNVERARFGLQPLAWQAKLAPVALGHSADMARRGYFAHASPEGHNAGERYSKAGFRCAVPISGNRYATGGENIAQTHTFSGYRVSSDGTRTRIGARTLDEVANRVVQGWMDSPGHRENILRPYWRTEAIGVFIDSQGRVFATENFC